MLFRAEKSWFEGLPGTLGARHPQQNRCYRHKFLHDLARCFIRLHFIVLLVISCLSREYFYISFVEEKSQYGVLG